MTDFVNESGTGSVVHLKWTGTMGFVVVVVDSS